MRNRFYRFGILLLSVAAIAGSCETLQGQNSPPSNRSTDAADTDEFRDWKDVTGQHSIRAQFVGVINRTKVALLTKDGKEMTIELSKLSNADIYAAVEADLMRKIDTARSTPPRSSSAQSNVGSRSATPSGPNQARRPRAVATNAVRPRRSSARPASTQPNRPTPTIDDAFKRRIQEMIDIVENSNAEAIFEQILHPEEFAKFKQSPTFDKGLEKFAAKKKPRLLKALRSIKFKTAQKKPGGKIVFQTESEFISFKNAKGIWYLNN